MIFVYSFDDRIKDNGKRRMTNATRCVRGWGTGGPVWTRSSTGLVQRTVLSSNDARYFGHGARLSEYKLANDRATCFFELSGTTVVDWIVAEEHFYGRIFLR